MPRCVAVVLLCVVACDVTPREQLDPHGSQPVASAAANRAPLRNWMRAELLHGLKQGDFGRLATAFDALAALRPPGLDSWESFARDGARAAAAHDLDEVRRLCMTCHNAYRARYRDTLRSRPIGSLKGSPGA